jgi:FxLD family lantipeptide
MTPSMNSSAPLSGTAADSDPFDLDIRIIESSDEFATLINLTDDGCGSSCPSACATNVG